MSGDKKLWRLPPPFRKFSRKQGLRLKSEVGHSRSSVASVYLSDGPSKNGFIIVPEFDRPVRTQASHEESNHVSYRPKLPVVTSSNISSHNGFLFDLEPIGSRDNIYLGGGPCDISIVDPSRDDDLAQRLGFAYEYIRSMPSATSTSVSLSSDPQILRKQLGVPQHSVFNYPIRSSPDLPNPHTSLPEPTSPRSPPATSPGVPHKGTSRKLGLCINTDVYPPSPRHCSPDPFQLAQRESAETTSTLTENPLHCSNLGASWSAPISCRSKPQPSVPNSWKLAKRRVEKHTVPLSSVSSSRLQALRGVLRKSAADTTPSATAHRWQIVLPRIRPASPLRVDIPLHHSWHDRRTDFNNSSECHSKIVQLQETKSRRTSGSTEILASLAWIGAPQMASSFNIANRRRSPPSPVFFPDRLSMAIAVDDDRISDDVLADQLEGARRLGSGSQRGSDFSPSRWSSGNAYFRNFEGDENGHFLTCCPPSSTLTPGQLAEPCNVPPPSPLISTDTTPNSEDAAVWHEAKKALLCIREIIRTEKRYQEALKMLLDAQTATPPPPSMAPYISALVRASDMLLKCFLEDPSAWGVSTAFVTSEDELEAAMVSWCAVAGAFFTDGNDPPSSGLTSRWRLRRSGMMSNSGCCPVTKQAPISLSPQLPSMVSLNSTSRTKDRMDEEYSARQYLQTEQDRQITSVSPPNPKSTNIQTLTSHPSNRRLSVRDLAIQPIQRVMRYVLLYKDLFDCTPSTSPSHLLVEHALEAATRVADHCDRAQRNPAFCHAS